jgi:hypothetical protein
MNYWFYYLSSWIILVGLWWQYRGWPTMRVIAFLSAPLIAAATVTVAMVMELTGGVRIGFFRLLDVLVARAFDVRLPGGSWYPDQKFMNGIDWLVYPVTLASRISDAFSVNFALLAVAATCTLFVLSLQDKRSLTSLSILLLGGFAWYFVMIQHTSVHTFSGQYSFMAICPLFGIVVSRMLPLCAFQTYDLFKRRKVLKGSEKDPYVIAAMTVVFGAFVISSFVTNTYALVTKTFSFSAKVEIAYMRG